MTLLDDYRRVCGPFGVPAESLTWQLYGAGLDHLRLETLPVPEPADDQLLVRVDAVGICTSDWKMIAQGESHARMRGRNLPKEPTVPGHEVSLTAVRAGRKLRRRYKPGQRFCVQADIYLGGENIAYGYKMRGGDQQYQLIGPDLYANGYLLRVDPALGYAQAALAEPWACVFHAYHRHRPTHSVRPGGTAWYVGTGPLGLMHIEKGIRDGAATVIASDIRSDRLEKVERNLGPLAASRGVRLLCVNVSQQPIGSVLPKHGADDILMLSPVAEVAAAALEYLAKDAYFNMFAGFEGRDTAWMRMNLNDMHYGGWTLLATSGSPIETLRQVLKETAAGRIDPNNAVACIGGIRTVRDAIHHTHAGTYPGRIVIYPSIDMPLVPVTQLTPDGRWTVAAEAALLSERLG
jgi:L-sorbose 1-phosphate reductase